MDKISSSALEDYNYFCNKNAKTRKSVDFLFRCVCCFASLLPFCFLACMFVGVFIDGCGAFFSTKILFEFDKVPEVVSRFDASELINSELQKKFPGISFEDSGRMMSIHANRELMELVYSDATSDYWLSASSEVDQMFRNPENRFNNPRSIFVESLESSGEIRKFFNLNFFLNADSSDPNKAGVLGAFLGSMLTIIVCVLVAVPIGIMTGIYLEEFMLSKNPFVVGISKFIQTSVNNLSSTPAIIFGILGLSIYINFFGVPRSSALAGGLTLSMMMLPTLIITTRQSISSVPSSIKQAALALGALRMQVVLHHTLPIALPNIVTGVVLGIARVLGESAPLLMIGMVAFVGDLPSNFIEPATVFPTQIYIWGSNPEDGYREVTSATILVLLLALLLLNLFAHSIRKRFVHKFD